MKQFYFSVISLCLLTVSAQDIYEFIALSKKKSYLFKKKPKTSLRPNIKRIKDIKRLGVYKLIESNIELTNQITAAIKTYFLSVDWTDEENEPEIIKFINYSWQKTEKWPTRGNIYHWAQLMEKIYNEPT